MMTRYGYRLALAGLGLLTALAVSPGTGAEPEKKKAEEPKKIGTSLDGYRWELNVPGGR